jgi:hypothetical protein
MDNGDLGLSLGANGYITKSVNVHKLKDHDEDKRKD